jgi:hypothetical protein
MVPLLIVGLIAGLPVLLAIIFRVSAVFLFLSIAVGNLLVLYLGMEAGLVSGLVSTNSSAPMVAQLVLLFVPVILTLLLLRKSLPKHKVLMHLLPLLACGFMLMAVALPLLPGGVQGDILASPAGPYFDNTQNLIVGSAALLVLLLTWLTHRSHELHPHHAKKRRH